jgi:hypothetical protein
MSCGGEGGHTASRQQQPGTNMSVMVDRKQGRAAFVQIVRTCCHKELLMIALLFQAHGLPMHAPAGKHQHTWLSTTSDSPHNITSQHSTAHLILLRWLLLLGSRGSSTTSSGGSTTGSRGSSSNTTTGRHRLQLLAA